ncbi:MAG: hypothetical protein FJ298_15535 [Planctomycetes bacterium]|nr:hypothetical protein [Planctomycetota bacterium]
MPPPSGADTPSKSRALKGTLRFFDPFGVHGAVARGSFSLHANSEEEPRTVAVEQGAWSVEIPEEPFELSAFTAEDARVFLHASTYGLYQFPADGVLDLLVRRDLGCRLVVVDAASGRELVDVEVVRDSGQGNWGKRSPDGSAEEVRIAEHAASPVELAQEEDSARYFVRGAGYAWRTVGVQRSACGDRVVALRPGGDLTVLLGGAPAPDGAEVRLRGERDTNDPYATQYVEHRRAIGALDRRLDFDSIEAGGYEVSVEVGVNTWRSTRITAKNVVVERGKRAQVEFVLPSPEPATLVEAGGTIQLSGWPEARSLTLHSRFAPRVGGKPEYRALLSDSSGPPEAIVHTWSIGAIEPGAYSGFIGGASHYFDFVVAAENRSDYVIVLPPPADVRLRVLDARTGAPADVERVGWLGYAGEWRPGGQINSAQLDPELGLWRFHAPATTVSIWINDEDYEFRNTPIELVPGVNERELRVPRACGIIATFVHAGVPIARDVSWTIELAHPDGKEAGYANPLDDAEMELVMRAPAPGRYRITAEGLDGYRIVSSLDVTVPIDGFARVVVELERVR